MNIMNAHEWILCASKKAPGRFYYFNSQSGQSIWTTDESETRPQIGMKPNCHSNPFSKCRNYPEPTSPPGPGPNNWYQQENHCYHYRPYDNPVFGQPAYPKFPHYMCPTEPKRSEPSWYTITQNAKPKEVFGERFSKKCECHCKKDFEPLVFRQEYPWKANPFRHEPKIFASSSFSQSQPQSRKRSLSTSENCFATGNSAQNMTKSQSLEDLSLSLANDVEVPEARRTEQNFVEKGTPKKPASNAGSVAFSEESDLEKIDLRYLLERKKKSGGAGYSQAKKIRTSFSETQGDNFNKDLFPKKRVTFNISIDEDDDDDDDHDQGSQFDQNDQFDHNRHKHTDVSDNIGELGIGQNDYGQDGQFDATGLGEEEYEEENLEVDATSTINVFANLATADHNPDLWLVVVDMEALMMEMGFLEELLKKDPTCSLLVPAAVKSQASRRAAVIPIPGTGTTNTIAIAARSLVRILQAPPSWITVQNIDPAHEQNEMTVEESIISCCLEMARSNYHVVLLTDNDKLSTKAKKAGIYSFKLQDVKHKEAEIKTEVTFDLVKIPAEKKEQKTDDLFYCYHNQRFENKEKASCDGSQNVTKNLQSGINQNLLFRGSKTVQFKGASQNLFTQNCPQTNRNVSQTSRPQNLHQEFQQTQQLLRENQCNTCCTQKVQSQKQTQNLSPRTQNTQMRLEQTQSTYLRTKQNNRDVNSNKILENIQIHRENRQRVTERKRLDEKTEIKNADNQQKDAQETSKSTTTSRRIKLIRRHSLNTNLLANNEENAETQNGGTQPEAETAILNQHSQSPVIVFKKKQSNTTQASQKEVQNMDFENVNCYNLNEHLKKFVVTSKIMEEKITQRIEGYMCFLKQITETTLQDFLESFPSPLFPRTPWTVPEALSCVGQAHGHNATVAALADRLAHHWAYYDDLKHKTVLLPSEFMRMYGCTVLLFKVLQSLAPSCPPLTEALSTLRVTRDTLATPAEDDTPSSAGLDQEGVVVTHVIKDSKEIISYLKKHYPVWRKHYDNLKEVDSSQNAKPIENPKTKHAPTLKVNKGKLTTKETAKLIKNLAVTSTNVPPKMREIDVEKREKDNVVLTNMISDILGKKIEEKTVPHKVQTPIEVNVLVQEHVESSHGRFDLDALDFNVMTDDSDDSSDDNHEGENVETETKNHDKETEILKTEKGRQIENRQLIERNKSILKNDLVDRIDLDQNSDETGHLVVITDEDGDHRDTDGTSEAKVTSTNLVPISNVDMSRQIYEMIKMFLVEISAALKVCHAFISAVVMGSNRPISHRRAIGRKVSRARVHMTEILHDLKRIIDRKSPEVAILNSILFSNKNNNNGISNDSRTLCYRQVVSNYFEQVQLVDSLFRNLLSASNENMYPDSMEN